jgi:RNA recognition motif-containing protein
LKETEDIEKEEEEHSSASSDTAIPPEEPEEDVPVKSHAALRKERKRALKQTEVINITENTKEKSAKPQNVAAPARQNSVWVGNLAFKTTSESLKKFFDGVGEITRVHMPTKNVGQGGKKFNVQGDNMGYTTNPLVSAALTKTVVLPMSILQLWMLKQ